MSTPHGPAATIEGVLEALRRGQRQLTRDPRRAIEGAVAQLLSLGRNGAAPPASGDDVAPRTYRVDDLARASGVTVRNIRAYQERGLLHAPERRGRIALFDDSHLTRLRLITSMLDRGYTSQHIREMLDAWEQGRDLADVLGLEQALVPPSIEDAPVTVTLDDALDRAGGRAELDQLVAAEMAEIHDDEVRLLRPRLLEAMNEVRSHGMSLERLLALHLEVSAEVDRITGVLVAAGFEQLAGRFVSQLDSSEDIAEMVELLTRYRTLALTSVTATLSQSIERSIEGLLADYLAAFLERAEESTG